MIEESAFKGCKGLKSCLIAENANLQRIEKEVLLDHLLQIAPQVKAMISK
jgi:hypothetical protein